MSETVEITAGSPSAKAGIEAIPFELMLILPVAFNLFFGSAGISCDQAIKPVSTIPTHKSCFIKIIIKTQLIQLQHFIASFILIRKRYKRRNKDIFLTFAVLINNLQAIKIKAFYSVSILHSIHISASKLNPSELIDGNSVFEQNGDSKRKLFTLLPTNFKGPFVWFKTKWYL